MKLPGFNAEAALRPRTRVFRSVAGFAGPSAVLRAATCSQSCLNGCLDDCSDCGHDGPGCFHACARHNAQCWRKCCD
jgi:hypothetical protein